MTKVITYGTYDLLHYGHIKLLERAKALGDYLIVGITSDDYDKTRGKINNQQSLMERIEAVKATGLADEIIVEEYEGQKIDDIRRYNIDIFTVGSDWEGKFDYLKEYCQVVYLPRTEGVSSSEIRSQKRMIKMGIWGNLGIAKKFAREIQYVNGVELVDCKKDLSNVDAVYIATVPQNHYQDVLYALNQGKHVICASPFATKREQCKELIDLAEKKGLILAEGIKTAYATAYSRILLLAKSGKIGDIISVDVNCSSMASGAGNEGVDLSNISNALCGWGPTTLLPVFQLLGTDYLKKTIVSRILDQKLNFDGFTKIDFIYKKAVASIKVAVSAKTEGELVISGTKGYIYVPAPWWNTDYFEVRYENQTENKRYFYQLDGDGIRYEIVAFVRAIENGKKDQYIDNGVSLAISSVIDDFFSGEYITI